MATEKEYVSAHLDENYHVFNNGTTGKLCVTPWNRSTVADGYWQNVNTIKPLINRDIYLAECLDEIASKYTVYTPGEGINIDKNENLDDSYIISVDKEFTNNLPKYSFQSEYFSVSTDEETHSATVGLKLAKNVGTSGAISVLSDEYGGGIYCNLDYLVYNTSALTSYSSFSGEYTSALTYTYNTATLNTAFVQSLPETPENNYIYIMG